jgi:arylsulfatase A-like enzyme
VLVGDHGEAFGRHGQTTHASHIYEENLHVPCVFLNPAFSKKEFPGLGGLIDIAPTILSFLNQPAPAMWQGKDLFTATENDRVYFFASWSDYLFGYREGKHKYIFNATRNLTEVYDLESDPLESNNIVDKVESNIEVTHQRMAGWVQSVNRFIEERTKNTR